MGKFIVSCCFFFFSPTISDLRRDEVAEHGVATESGDVVRFLFRRVFDLKKEATKSNQRMKSDKKEQNRRKL